MIEVHVTNALLATSLRHTQAFRVVDFVNGLVAPAFLFCAGYAAASGQHSLARDAKRSGVLVALGYLLHSSALLRADWSGFFQADVLQIMGISLMGVSVVARLAKKRAAVAWTAVAALCLLLAPASRSLDSASHAPLSEGTSQRSRVPMPKRPSAVLTFSLVAPTRASMRKTLS